MKKLVFVSAFLLIGAINFSSFAVTNKDTTGTISTVMVKPSCGDSKDGCIFVTLSVTGGSVNFYIHPSDIAYEAEFTTLLYAKDHSSNIKIGFSDAANGYAVRDVISYGTTYYPIYYIQLQ